jgi:2-dehydro-3-deoxy-D-gluconate 5-dehydrogenase
MKNSAFSLEGKTAIVTGGSKGLGRAIAEAYACAGADVAVVSRGSGESVCQAIHAVGRQSLHIEADLSSTACIADIISRTLDAFGRLDILVNNAGIIRREDSTDFTEQDWDDVMNVNLKTLFFLSQAAAKQFIFQGSVGSGGSGGGDEGRGNGKVSGSGSWGKIISIASLLSYQGGIHVPSYTASKSGLKGLTMLMCNEWAKYHIQVNAIAPGYMVTENTEALRNDQARYNAILDRIPAGRWGDPEDLTGAAVFLASSASDYVNGFTLAVDGGWLAR